MKISVLLSAGLLLAGAIGGAGVVASERDAMPSLRALAITIEQALDDIDRGHTPEARELARLQFVLDDLGRQDLTRQAAAKQRAIARLFGELKHRSAHPTAQRAGVALAAPGTLTDSETVAPGHGDSCANALGVSPQLPVRLTLATAGDAWLRFDPGSTGTAQFHTQSRGADPALQVFRACTGSAAASDDDSFGLDASASAAAQQHVPLLVHLINTGGSGSVLIGVSANDTTISGTITDGVTHAPIANAYIQLLSAGGGYYGSTATDSNGNYTVMPFANAGSFYVFVSAQSYVAEIYPAAECLPGYYGTSISGCDANNAQLVAVTAGQTLAGVDMALSAGHAISGAVLDGANAPVPGSIVNLYDSAGDYVYSTNVDASGAYLFTTLPPHDYKLSASNGNYTSQMYDHVACDAALQNQCNLANAGALHLDNSDISGIDFSLQRLASIQGTVRDGGGGPPVPYAYVTVVDANGSLVATATADYSTGAYSAGPLGTGTYRASAVDPGYFSQAFSAIDCATVYCMTELPTSTTIVVTQLGQQPQADFSLRALPAISGHVQDTQGRALKNISVFATIDPNSSSYPYNSANTDENGNYALHLQQAGQYFIWALSANFIDKIYPNLVCESFNDSYYPSASCNLGGAVTTHFVPGAALPAFDFTLSPSSRIAGNVTVYAGPGAQIAAAGVAVGLFDGTNRQLLATQTDTQGNYYFNDLPPGTFYAEAYSNYSNQSYYAQVWPHQDCGNNCIPVTGAPISVTSVSSTTGIDFSLIELDAILGRVTDGGGQPVVGGVIDLFSAPDGTYNSSYVTDQQGFYRAAGGLGNQYYVATEVGAPYVEQVFAGVSCPLGAAYYGQCAVNQGTIMALSQNDTQPHIADFVLQLQDSVFANGFE